MSEEIGNLFNSEALDCSVGLFDPVDQCGSERVPLRYNNDKRKKASIQGAFCVCRCFSIPFPTVDYQRENCREKGAVKVKTKNLKRAFHFSE